MNNQKGSVLLLTLMVFSILMVTGLCILTTSISNIEMQSLSVNSKKGFYACEGGHDLAYGALKIETQRAIEYANNRVNNF